VRSKRGKERRRRKDERYDEEEVTKTHMLKCIIRGSLVDTLMSSLL